MGGLQGNDAKGGWIIRKFGGTSVGKFAAKIAEEIVTININENKIAIVCSARSTDTKAEGTTNRLLRAAEEALKLQSRLYIDIVDAIRDDHIQAVRQQVRSKDIIDALENKIQKECGRLASFLGAAQVGQAPFLPCDKKALEETADAQSLQIINEISPKTRDIIIGTGEKLACLFMTAVLQDRGIDAEYVNLENIIHNSYPTRNGLDQEFYDYVAKQLAERIQECEGRIPVVTGYFGTVPGSILSSIGRGYTDLCAALLAVGLDAEELQVWKEVDGIFTADPGKVSAARVIPIITPEEAAELTYYGSEVIHPFTMEQVIKARIPIRIKNVKAPIKEGTIIFPDSISQQGEVAPTSLSRRIRLEPQDDPPLRERSQRPTAVTIKNNIVIFNIRSNRKSLSHDFLANIFSVLGQRRLTVDLISTSEVHVSMALHSEAKAHDLKDAAEELRKYGTVDVNHGMAILSLVGKQMKHMIGIASRMFDALAKVGINIEMISQGASEINISCVIKEADALKAVNVLHTRLFVYQD